MSDAQVISADTLRNLQNIPNIQGLILCQDYNIEKTKNNKEYIKGTLYSGVAVQFKAWGDSAAFATLKEANHRGMAVYIMANVDEYKGNYSLTVTNIQAVNLPSDTFLATKYDINTYWNALIQLFESQVSPETKSIADKIFANDTIKNRFCMEFAAKSHHDNCKSGLLAHTYKVMLLLNYLLSAYPNLTKNDQHYKDILYLGVFLHDIGKINEMEYGVYKDNSFVSHRYFGLEYIFPLKEEIIDKLGESNYYNLVSIITQHHGKWGEPCASLSSFIVHTIDNLDATFTTISEDIIAEKDTIKTEDFILHI